MVWVCVDGKGASFLLVTLLASFLLFPFIIVWTIEFAAYASLMNEQFNDPSRGWTSVRSFLAHVCISFSKDTRLPITFNVIFSCLLFLPSSVQKVKSIIGSGIKSWRQVTEWGRPLASKLISPPTNEGGKKRLKFFHFWSIQCGKIIKLLSRNCMLSNWTLVNLYLEDSIQVTHVNVNTLCKNYISGRILDHVPASFWLLTVNQLLSAVSLWTVCRSTAASKTVVFEIVELWASFIHTVSPDSTNVCQFYVHLLIGTFVQTALKSAYFSVLHMFVCLFVYVCGEKWLVWIDWVWTASTGMQNVVWPKKTETLLVGHLVMIECGPQKMLWCCLFVLPCIMRRGKRTPTGGLKPPTTRLRAVRSTDWAR